VAQSRKGGAPGLDLSRQQGHCLLELPLTSLLALFLLSWLREHHVLMREDMAMDETSFGLRVRVPLDHDRAVERATAALQEEGFGVLTTIDVKQTLKQKLDADFRKYTILGACNPALAHRALLSEIEIGLLLPCNVVVYETGPTESIVAAMSPLPTIGIVGDNPDLTAVAREADVRLRRVVTSLEGGPV
jgi:uncharacterized protein (DUF302 family)